MKKLTRNSIASNEKTIEINYSGPSLSDLPDNILVTILLRLTVKSIVVCKCVCKTWYDLISDPDFAKLHFNQAQAYPLLRSWNDTLLSKVLYLVQPQQDDFECKLEMSYDSSPIEIKLDCNLKLPWCNIRKIFDMEEIMNKNWLELYNMNREYKIVNSCNGLLCLSDLSDKEPVIVCNPVTNEFINLPEVATINDNIIGCALGFSPATSQYKVIRIFTRYFELKRVMMAEVHTLGTQTWRVLHSSLNSTCMSFPTYLNGCVYWFSKELPYFATSFDIEKECFESISTPPFDTTKDKMSMGVLGGELIISAFQYYQKHNVRFWAMKDNGATKSWSQIFSFDNESLPDGSYQPIEYLHNGELLVLNSYKNALICMDTRKNRFRYLKVCGFKLEVEAIAHIPSLVPLKHALSGLQSFSCTKRGDVFV